MLAITNKMPDRNPRTNIGGSSGQRLVVGFSAGSLSRIPRQILGNNHQWIRSWGWGNKTEGRRAGTNIGDNAQLPKALLMLRKPADRPNPGCISGLLAKVVL